MFKLAFAELYEFLSFFFKFIDLVTGLSLPGFQRPGPFLQFFFA